MTQKIRQADAAGSFYPAAAEELTNEIKNYLSLAAKKETLSKVKAIIVPHAGYYYSGEIAAHAYKQLENEQVRTVYLLCNSHVIYFEGIAVDDSDAWQTPLGLVLVDKTKAGKLADFYSEIKLNSAAHLHDHTIEVQLPFLQNVLSGNFKIVPILFGNLHDDSYEQLAQALQENLSEDDLIVISTDMSHYPSHELARMIDNKTLDIIKQGDLKKLEEYMREIESQNIPGEQTILCGIDGVRTILSLAQKMNWDMAEILKYGNSGDLPSGDKGRVVGYGAVAFGRKKNSAEASADRNSLSDGQKEQLKKIAGEAIATFIKNGTTPDFDIVDERLHRHQGAFVTLHRDGQLRGCIGQIVPSDDPLWKVVRDMSIAAAVDDPRFLPVDEKELEKIQYEVSVLSVPEKISDWRKIELGRHGVIVKKGYHTGVFLPQVAAETNWSLEEFLDHLCEEKAGLPAGCYKDDKSVELLVFTAQVF